MDCTLPIIPPCAGWLAVTCLMGLRQEVTQPQCKTSSLCTEQLKSSPLLLTPPTGYTWSARIRMEGGMHQILSTLLLVTLVSFSCHLIIILFTGTPTIIKPKLAAVQIPVKESGIRMYRLNRGMLSVRPSKSISPHVLMGESAIHIQFNISPHVLMGKSANHI